MLVGLLSGGQAARPRQVFAACSFLPARLLSMPRPGGAAHARLNGVHEAIGISLVFPPGAYRGASAVVQSPRKSRLCKLSGNTPYPLYLVHYPLAYFYGA